MAPMRPVMQMKQPAMEYPIHTQSHDCHQERPFAIMEDEIIHVFWYDISRCWCVSAGCAHDIEGVGNPETNKIPWAPLPSLRFDWFQIVIRQHHLGIGEARLRLDSQFSREHFDLLFGSHTVHAHSAMVREVEEPSGTDCARKGALRNTLGDGSTNFIVAVQSQGSVEQLLSHEMSRTTESNLMFPKSRLKLRDTSALHMKAPR